MVKQEHLDKAEGHDVGVNELIQPPREEGINFKRKNEFSIDRVKQPKENANIERQRKGECAVHVISYLSYQWPVFRR